ncbi:MAG: hypothetical protein HY760_05990, partial [Nitrospirae bacterium]|nr:hypothetical protein [Nitrospirota bacterium]
MKNFLTLFRGKKSVQPTASGIPLIVHPGFKQDEGMDEPLIRLNQKNRERFGVKPGASLQVRRGEITLKIRVEVAGIEDSAAVCRLNPKARKDLGVNLNETIEVVPASHPLGSVGIPLAVQPASKDDLLSDEPILRMSREDRERLGIEVG